MSEDGTAQVGFSLELGPRTMDATVRVPAGCVALPVLLPVLQSFNDALVGVAVERAGQAGETISCRKGCGACCRQMVPISETEAAYLADLIANLPEERQAEIRSRFSAALDRLAGAGLLASIRNIPQEAAAREKVALEYFRLGISCPFLEDEACSIHPQRPMICREYLVTSPAAHCAHPTPETIRRVPTVAKASQALYAFVQGPPRYLALVDLLDWRKRNPDAVYPVAPGPELLRAFVTAVARQIKREEQESE